LWLGHKECLGEIPESLLMGSLEPFFPSAGAVGKASPSVKLLNVSGNEFLQGSVQDAVFDGIVFNCSGMLFGCSCDCEVGSSGNDTVSVDEMDGVHLVMQRSSSQPQHHWMHFSLAASSMVLKCQM